MVCYHKIYNSQVHKKEVSLKKNNKKKYFLKIFLKSVEIEFKANGG